MRTLVYLGVFDSVIHAGGKSFRQTSVIEHMRAFEPMNFGL